MMKKIILSLLSLVFVFNAVAQDIPERPNPPKLVNDFANVLQNSEIQLLEHELVRFNNETSTQIVLVTVPSLNGYDASDFAFRLGENWGVGQKGKNNGIVVLFKPKTNNERGQIYIATGYGLEGVIPDAVANGTIIDNEMIPRFKNGDTFGGLYKGIHVLMDLSRGEYTADQYQQQAAENKGGGRVFFVLFFLIFFILIPLLRGRRGSTYSRRGGSSLPFWIAMGMMGSSRHSHSGSWSNFSGGSGGFGGGGFGGFGGGSFGGGGAGGSW